MHLNSIRWTLGALAGLALAACAETATDQDVASAEAPQALEQEGPPRHHDGERHDGPRHRHDPAKLVERFDANANGSLELSELPEHKRERMAAADENKDGVLSVAELEKHRPMKHGMGPRDPAAMIAHLDANANGTLEVTELPEHKRERMAAADANKDGSLSAEELAAHFEQHRQHHDPAPPAPAQQ